MRGKFVNWLKYYKEYSDKKAENIAETIDELSDLMVLSREGSSHFYLNQSFVSFAKARKSLFEYYDCSSTQKKALELFGDYLQVVEISHIEVATSDESKLYQAVKTMKMQYSYKAVLLLLLIQSDFITTVDFLTEGFCNYYSARIENDLIPEQNQSVFSRSDVDFGVARKVIITNPIKALSNAGILINDTEYKTIALASKYIPSNEELKPIVLQLKHRLESYYKALATKAIVPDEIVEAINLIEQYVSKIDGSYECMKMLDELKRSIEKLYIENNSKAQTSVLEKKEICKIKPNDDRKVGKLVRETMEVLSDIGHVFTEEQIMQFLNKEKSKELFNVNYPFLREFNPNNNITEQTKDHNGESRYWSKVFSFGGKQYLITSEWYIKDRPYYISWFNSII